jgi:hypothetical protein
MPYEPGIMTENRKSSHMPLRWKHLWVRVLALGLGFVLVGFLAWFFIGATPPSSTGEEAPQAQAQSGQNEPAGPQSGTGVPAELTAILKIQLEQVLAGIKEANQKKNLSQFLSHYSPNFPQLTQRSQSISKNWKIYDYPKMEFEIKEIRSSDDNTALARVTWDVEAQNISTLKRKNISKTYLIRFTKESGQWRIKALDEAE